MKYTYLLLVCLLAFTFSCAPRYGAHFQPSSDNAYATRANEEKENTTPQPTETFSTEVVSPRVQKVTDKEAPEASALLVQRSEQKMKDLRLPVMQQEDQLLRSIKERIASMSAKERRALKKQIKTAVEEYKVKHLAAEAEAPQQSDTNLLLLILITILIPPLGMFLYEGDITNRFWISLLLTLLFYVPGLIYTLVVILGDK